MTTLAIDLCERGLLPDFVTRFGMRRLMAERLADESLDRCEREFGRFRDYLAELRQSQIAVETAAANEQHYELPAAFFQHALGTNLKYSCCWFPDDVADSALADALDAAEARMLALTCERAELADGQRVLELGCGWGSLTLWMARQYPASHITAVSNSASQREFILGRCAAEGLTNVNVITADANEFATADRFDRVVSVEMFEHMRNYGLLMQRIAEWLRPDGKLFVHIFCHRHLMYPFTTEGEYDWMGKYFFTGGLMPAESTLLYFQNDLRIEDQWRVSGRHYEKTSNAWLQRMDRNRAEIMPVFVDTYGAADAERWFQRWRMFFMAVAELFGYANGTEWMVAHYRFRKA
ncbi:MAG: class I SAM-dependent methyltransferase [Gammaproteobacteria bacterium]|jgi:cyclopropane-fatty-acyl-phospholipid synthase|nr:class I SAM-dependent methyltransferase [Gammaproteobacteria bacterium]